MAFIHTGTAELGSRPCSPEHQVAAICYRRKAKEIEFLLVNTSAGKWTFPKGGIDAGKSPCEAALQEAWEEAGAFGAIHQVPFTSYLHERGDESVLINAFLLHVQRTAEPIETFRNPRWFSPEAAKKSLGEFRSARYRREFERVVDLALARLRQHAPSSRRTKNSVI